MANMSYCRFENTVQDMEDCLEHMDTPLEDLSSDYERSARKKIVEVARDIIDAYGHEIDVHIEED